MVLKFDQLLISKFGWLVPWFLIFVSIAQVCTILCNFALISQILCNIWASDVYIKNPTMFVSPSLEMNNWFKFQNTFKDKSWSNPYFWNFELKCVENNCLFVSVWPQTPYPVVHCNQVSNFCLDSSVAYLQWKFCVETGKQRKSENIISLVTGEHNNWVDTTTHINK